MLKWIGGGCLVIVLIVAGVLYFSYRQMSKVAEGGPTTSVTIGAPPARVFASLANADSLPTWRLDGMGARTSRKGMLMPGDTLLDAVRDTARVRLVWIVDTIVPNQLLATNGIDVSTGRVMFTRRDSLAGAGDSTIVTTTTEMMAPPTGQDQPAGAAGGIMGMATRMGGAAMRLQAEKELEKLKGHIEGRPVVPPDSLQLE